MSLMSQLPFVTNLHGKFVTVVGGILIDVFVLLITKLSTFVQYNPPSSFLGPYFRTGNAPSYPYYIIIKTTASEMI